MYLFNASHIRVLILISLGLICPFCSSGESRGTGADAVDGIWLVRVDADENPRLVAESLGGKYLEPVEGVNGYHRIRFSRELEDRPGTADWRQTVRRRFEQEALVEAFEEDVSIVRYPKVFTPQDTRFPEQWHLENVGQSGGLPFADINVRPVWDAGFSGQGVTIAIVDEGTQFRHPDLEPNWLAGSGYDYNDDDSDPSPSGSDDRHGTAVAGISLASANRSGGLGVAYEAKLVPLRLIAGSFRIGEEAEALSYRRQQVDIYNNSWGPSDEFGVQYVDSSSILKNALADNVRLGRGGLGNIYVWAAGNGGLNGDNSNYDGYNALPYTISVGAVGHDDIRAGYSEPGANLLVVAPSGGRGAGILTTDNTGSSGYAPGDVYENFSGTSAATPVVSGVAALLLEKRPDLSWRDVQQILAMSASPVDFNPEKWDRNGAGYWVSHEYGFGRVDANAALQLAEGWPLLGPMQVRTGSLTTGFMSSGRIPEGQTVNFSITLSNAIRVQHVRARVDLTHSNWGDLRIELISPEGTRSILSEPHANANASGEPGIWTYLSTHHLGELSAGLWTLSITDERDGDTGSLDSWTLEIWGTSAANGINQRPRAEDLFLESAVFPIEVDSLENLADPDGDPVSIIAVQQPRSGSLESLGGGRFKFTMGNSIDGSDQFSVLVSDGRGGVFRRFIRILDPRPVAQNDLYPVLRGTATELPVLRNDFDPDGDPLRVVSVGAAIAGTTAITSNQTILYTPFPGFSGVERIQYTVTDDSDGESSGWVTAVVQASAEVALEFDGEDDFLILENSPELLTNDQFTAEAWINPESWGEYVTGFGRIFDRDSFVFFLNGFDHSFYNDRSLVAYFVLNNGQAVAANSVGGSINLDEWQHVAVSYDSSNPVQPVRMYVNGSEVGVSYPLPGTGSPNRSLSDNRNAPLFMGESDSGARAFKGLMTEFRIWDRVLSPSFITGNHDRRLMGNEAGLRLYLPLDQTLEPEARSLGQLDVTAQIYGAQRAPLELPWKDLVRHYSLIEDAGNGWWRERTLGWIYGDSYPWVFLTSLNWAYTGHPASATQYTLFRPENNWGWVETQPGLFPWFYHFGTNDWFRYLEGSSEPAWFYSSGSADWISGDAFFPGN